MGRKKHDYKAEARALKKYGVAFGFDLRKKLSPQAKSAISRKRHRLAGYVNEENRFKFVPVKSAAARRKLRGVVSRDQITGGGVFVQLPKRGRKKQSVRVTKKGELIVRTGRRKSTFVKVKGRILKSQSIEELRQKVYRATKGKKVVGVRLRVRGFKGKRQDVDLKTFFAYFKADVMDDLDLEDEDGEARDLNEVFSVEIITDETNRSRRLRN